LKVALTSPRSAIGMAPGFSGMGSTLSSVIWKSCAP
jgi:hypothetical protein